MKHLVILLFFLSFSSSILTLFLLIMMFLKNQSRILKYFFLFWLSFLGVLIIIFINTYGKINISGFNYTSILYLFAAGNGLTVLIFYFMLKFFTILRKTSFSKVEKIFTISFISFYLVQILVILLLHRDIQWKMDMIQLSSVPYNLILFIFLGINIFSVIKQRKSLNLSLTGNQAKLLFTLYCITIFFGVIDMITGFFPTVGQLYSFPVSYTFWSVIIFIYGILYYKKETLNRLHYSISNTFIEENHITPREIEIIQMLIKGLSCSEISEKLFIAYKTVDKHISNIYKKTGVHNRFQLMSRLLK